VASRCTHTCSVSSRKTEPTEEPGTGPLTLAELEAKDFEGFKGIGEKRLADLHALEVDSVLDLLMYYPRRWVDRTQECRVCDLVAGASALVVVDVLSVDKRVTRNGRSMVTARVGDDTGKFTLTFFNQPWRSRQLYAGLTISVWGKPDTYRGALQMTNPIVDLIGDRTGRIVPIYPQSGDNGVKTWEMAKWVEIALRKCAPRGVVDPVPETVRRKYHLVPRFEAMKSIHLPSSMDEVESARRRLAFDELLRVQTYLVREKKRIEQSARGIAHSARGVFVNQFVENLAFPLTSAQRRVIDEVTTDMSRTVPMNRLLQGDVGSGKTVVAVATLLTAVEGGYQGALMAPTEVLAEQHFAGVTRLLDGLVVTDPENLFGDRPVRVELLTNRVTGDQRRRVVAGLADGSIDIAIGTHALIQKGIEFKSLGAVVVDEQHRFGVEQRAKLREMSEIRPDTLVMTATPIPRTAALTIFGDLDVSVLDEMPPGRTPIVTHAVAGDAETAGMWAAVREAVGRGDQVYVVCPLIEESDKLEAASAEATFAELRDGELAGLRIGLMHGRMKSAEKDVVMDSFRRADLDVLVATTVIEVGVDVPNATQMVILDADRFGIAQLHQLRGRVGRGKKASTCWLVTRLSDDELIAEMKPRIEALVASTDGFELAEVDLQLRGEGTIMDKRQSGGSDDLKLASLKTDRDLIEAARDVAVDLVGDDTSLAAHPHIRDEVQLFIENPGREDFVVRN
jgi:ATP-dependent DNA helicase RecG